MGIKQRKLSKARVRTKIITHRPDYILFGICLILIVLGFVTLFSASALYGGERFSDVYFFIKRQFIVGILPGLIGGAIAYFISLQFVKKISPAIFIACLFFTALVFIPLLGVTIGGASRWLAIGPFSFQPSEFLKLGYILYLAALLAMVSQKSISRKKKRGFGNRFLSDSPGCIKNLLILLVISGLVALALVFQPDIGTLGIILAVGLIIYFVSGAPLFHIGLVGILLALFAIIFAHTAPYRIERIAVFLNPKIDPLGIGYHINQILIAIGSGGLSGLGLGMSQQKFGFIPQPAGDSIFAIFAEEFGFIGSIILIGVFVLFLWRGITIARQAPDAFSQLACVGIIGWIGAQAFINIGAMAGLIPLTGIPLPFFSYGGSAMASLLIGVGFVLNISRHTV